VRVSAVEDLHVADEYPFVLQTLMIFPRFQSNMDVLKLENRTAKFGHVNTNLDQTLGIDAELLLLGPVDLDAPV
jgi:hypothetical protein